MTRPTAEWERRWERAVIDHGLPPLRITAPAASAPGGGPGTRLKALLAGPPFWIGPDAGGCKCNERAALMDAWGVAGCKERRSEIVDWLTEQAVARGWPFAGIGAAWIVDRAIALAAGDEEAQ